MPFDQHQLIALIAPRPVMVTSAKNDKWADPQGEFLSLHHATPVYKLYGEISALPSPSEQPGTYGDMPLRYFLREGNHDVTSDDWQAMIAFVNKLP